MNKPRRSIGMLAWSTGHSWDDAQWRFQLYWPEIRIRKTEFFVTASTVLRLLWAQDSKGFGVKLLGLGCGVVWDGPVRPAKGA